MAFELVSYGLEMMCQENHHHGTNVCANLEKIIESFLPMLLR